MLILQCLTIRGQDIFMNCLTDVPEDPQRVLSVQTVNIT